ncbi:hypothetical protein BD410DRAFT_846078, partial [Rickenella mellea]
STRAPVFKPRPWLQQKQSSKFKGSSSSSATPRSATDYEYSRQPEDDIPIIDLRRAAKSAFDYKTDLDNVLDGLDLEKFPRLLEVPVGSLVCIIHTVTAFKSRTVKTFEHMHLSFNVWAVLVLTKTLNPPAVEA